MAAAVVGGLRQAAAGLLGVEDGAEAEQVRAAWKKKLKQAHRERASAEVLQALSEARDLLSGTKTNAQEDVPLQLAAPASLDAPDDCYGGESGLSTGGVFAFGFASRRGRRASLEDELLLASPLPCAAYAFGVFDGHGGSRASKALVAMVPSALGGCTAMAERLGAGGGGGGCGGGGGGGGGGVDGGGGWDGSGDDAGGSTHVAAAEASGLEATVEAQCRLEAEQAAAATEEAAAVAANGTGAIGCSGRTEGADENDRVTARAEAGAECHGSGSFRADAGLGADADGDCDPGVGAAAAAGACGAAGVNAGAGDARGIDTRLTMELQRAWADVDKELIRRAEAEDWDDGSTALIAVVRHETVILIQVGDSQAVIFDSDGPSPPLCEVHNIEANADERRRLEAAGARIERGRVQGLAVSRSFGDARAKRAGCGIVCTPQVTAHRLRAHSLLLIACDGVWDVLSPEQAHAAAADRRRHDEWDATAAAAAIVNAAIDLGSTDNVSAIAIAR